MLFCGHESGQRELNLLARLVASIRENGMARESVEDQQAPRSEEGAEHFAADCIAGDGKGFELWLGSLEDALCLQSLRERGINGILNCALGECVGQCAAYRDRGFSRRRTHARGLSLLSEGFEPGSPSSEDKRAVLDKDQVRALVQFDKEWYSDMLGEETAYCGFSAEDRDGYGIDRHFEEVVAFLRKCKAEGRKVLVHCVMGINRSTASLVAYLCEDFGMGLEEAVDLVSKRHGHVLSNETFIHQLIKCYNQEEGASTEATFSTGCCWRERAQTESCVHAC